MEENEITVETPQQEPQDDYKLKFEQLQKDVLYIKADFENTKKRLQREQEQALKFAHERFLRELAPVFDLLDQAVLHGRQKSVPSAEDYQQFLKGVEMTQHEFVQCLSRLNVELLGSEGESFDPNKHEAISQSPGGIPNTIAAVLQRGMLLHGRVVRPARVTVFEVSSKGSTDV